MGNIVEKEVNQTLLYPIIDNYVTEVDRIISDKIMAWRMFPAKWKLDVTDFYGKRIHYEGVTFKGTPQHVFWNGFIEPFLENGIKQTLQKVLKDCEERSLIRIKYLDEACALLEILIHKTYKNMVETEHFLRGKGFPRSVEPRNVSSNIKKMNQYMTTYRKALTHRGSNKSIEESKQSKAGQPMNSISEKRNVFVVHGRNQAARNALFGFLRSIGLQPIEWSQAVKLTRKASPYVGEILEVAFSHAQAVVVLLTGDDEVKLRSEFLTPRDHNFEKQVMPQARPNVLFEAGLAFGVHPERTILVELGQIKPFSDIAGRHVIKMDNSPEKRHELARRLETGGCFIDISGTDWLKEGDFEIATIQYNNKEPESKRDNELNEEQINILKYLSEIEDRGMDDIDPQTISRQLNISLSRIRYHLGVLDEKEYIAYSMVIGQEASYYLTNKGREFLIRRGLI